jgi:hypothetical protein
MARLDGRLVNLLQNIRGDEVALLHDWLAENRPDRRHTLSTLEQLEELLETEEDDVLEALEEALAEHRRRHHHLHLVVTIGFPDGSTATGADMSITVAPNATQKYPLTVSYADVFGVPVPTPPTAVFTWTPPDPTIATLDATTGTTVNLLTVGEGASVAPITVTDGTLTLSIPLTVGGAGAGVASQLVVTVGAPIPR